MLSNEMTISMCLARFMKKWIHMRKANGCRNEVSWVTIVYAQCQQKIAKPN